MVDTLNGVWRAVGMGASGANLRLKNLKPALVTHNAAHNTGGIQINTRKQNALNILRQLDHAASHHRWPW